MTLILSFLSLFILNADNSALSTVTDYIGEWEYTVIAPDATYKGIMEINAEDGELVGVIISEGEKIELKEVTIDGDELTFNMNVLGYPCSVKGKFDGDSFTGEVAVEGLALPMTASRVE